MSDHDLEEQLRSQRGPREEGYTPMPLPTSPEASRRNAGPSGPLRAGMFAGAAAAGVVVIVVAAGFLSRSATGVGSSTPSPSSAPGDCAPADVTFSAEPWGGATGSRGTVVTVSLADGRDDCMLSIFVGGQIQDADGKALVSSSVLGVGGRRVRLAPGAAYTIGVSWSNWCGGTPAAPITLLLRAEGWPAFMPVSTPAGGDDPVPPCMGGNTPSSLSLTVVQPAP